VIARWVEWHAGVLWKIRFMEEMHRVSNCGRRYAWIEAEASAEDLARDDDLFDYCPKDMAREAMSYWDE
jgi:hypothetical protein